MEITKLAELAVELIIAFLILWTKIKTGSGIKGLKIGMEILTKKDIIKQEMKKALEVVAIEQLKHIRHLDPKFKDMLILWAKKFEELAIDSYFSQYRHTDDTEHYLNSITGGFLADVELQLLQRIPDKKDGKTIIDFASKKGYISREIAVLIARLVENNLTDEKYVRLFSDTLSKLLDYTIDIFHNWNELKTTLNN